MSKGGGDADTAVGPARVTDSRQAEGPRDRVQEPIQEAGDPWRHSRETGEVPDVPDTETCHTRASSPPCSGPSSTVVELGMGGVAVNVPWLVRALGVRLSYCSWSHHALLTGNWTSGNLTAALSPSSQYVPTCLLAPTLGP
ncbi:hypothetical protein P7K49_035098, partial [Saguinus oedipus]